MNTPVRRVSMIVVVMFLALMAASSWVQVVQAGSLNADGRNSRALYREYGRERGPIVVAGKSVVVSTAVEDSFSYQREYSDAELYAAVTGYFSVYGGSTGIESARSSVLNGTSDSLFIQRLGDLVTGQDPAGGSVELTINPAVQQAAMNGLSGLTGAAVAIDPSTGAILALASTPSFDPNRLATHDKAAFNESFTQLNEDPARPLVNRAIRGDLYPPGSTFKLITAAAALESGSYSADSVLAAPTELTLPGTTATMKNYGGEVCSPTGQMSIHDAMSMSCNTLFGQLGMDLGQDTLRTQAQKFGFGTSVSIPMRSTASIFPASLNAPQLAQTAIGQFDTRATPLQMAMVAAAIANDGVEMQPYLVQTERGPNTEVVSEAEPEVFAQPISAGTADALTSMMVSVVDSGTGKAAAIPGVSVAGKTGTAETSADKAPHAWFVAFAPADNPRIAVAVIVENGGNMGNEATGGEVSAPIAKAMIQAAIGS